MKTTPAYFGDSQRCSAPKRSGFTLVEILVAVGIMALLLAIILVPLRLGFETYHIGTARTALQQEAQLTMQQMGKDFERASFVFPNGRIPGISDSTDSTSACSLLPYAPNGNTTGTGIDPAWKHLPYFKRDEPHSNPLKTDPATADAGVGITSPTNTLEAFANPNRIDMLFLRRVVPQPTPSTSATPSPSFSVSTGEDYVVSYYPRRLDISKAYDVIDNPIVLYRAQYPYRFYNPSGSTAAFIKFPLTTGTNPPLNAEVDWSQYPTLGSATVSPTLNRNFLWITHNYYGEANLEPLTQDVNINTEAEKVPRSHTLVIPRGMQLVAPKANSVPLVSGAYMPELSFVESSTNGKRIDRVTVNMTLAQYDQIGAASVNGQGKAQRVPVSQTFDLPNAGCSN